MSKKKIIAGILSASLLIAGSVCYAGSWTPYNTTVGAFNGQGFTGSSTANESKDHTAWLDSSTVGGNYTVDARLQGYSGSSYKAPGPWIQKVTDDKLYLYNYALGFKFKKGRFQFSNDLTTPVKVQVSGEFMLID